MIKVEELLYEIDLRLNKLATNDHQAIPPENKLLVLNSSQDQIVLNKISPNNVHKLGLDAFKKRYQDLQNLIENPEDHKTVPILTDNKLNKYSVDVNTLSPKFMFYIDSYMVADKDSCKNRVIATNADLAKHADIHLLLRDSNYKPSFEYQETIVDITKDKIHVYTDGTFSPSSLYISYLRYPNRIRLEGMEDFEGTPTENVDCELEDYLKNELIDLAVSKLAMYTENTPAVQTAELRKTTNE